MIMKECGNGSRTVYARAILHEQLRTFPVRQEASSQGLYVRISCIPTSFCIKIALYYNEFAPPRAALFIDPNCSPNHLRRGSTSTSRSNHLRLPFLPVVAKGPLCIATRTLLNRALIQEYKCAAAPSKVSVLSSERKARAHAWRSS
jgi:hypothetical protein